VPEKIRWNIKTNLTLSVVAKFAFEEVAFHLKKLRSGISDFYIVLKSGFRIFRLMNPMHFQIFAPLFQNK